MTQNNNALYPFRAIGAGVRIFIKHIRLFAVAAAVFYLPLYACAYLIPDSYRLALPRMQTAIYSQTAEGVPLLSALSAIEPSVLYPALVNALLLMLFSNLFATLAAGACLYILKTDIAKEAPTLSGLMDATVSRVHKYFITATILGLAEVLGSPFLLIPTVYIAVAIPFCECVIADTGDWGIKAFLTNLKLTRRKWLSTAWFLIVTIIVQQSVLSLIPITNFKAANVILSAVSGFICMPLGAALAILYFDRLKGEEHIE